MATKLSGHAAYSTRFERKARPKSDDLESKPTFTVEGKTFNTREEAEHYLEIERRKKAATKPLDQALGQRRNSFQGWWPETILERMVEHPEQFRKVLDILEGKEPVDEVQP